MALREAEAEFKRKGNFSLIFPAMGTSCYRSYFEEPRHLNTLLYKRCIEKGLFTRLKQLDRAQTGVGHQPQPKRATQTLDDSFDHVD